MGKIEKLKRMALKQQQRFEEISEWADVVVDKSNRKLVFKTMNEKKDYLKKLQNKNEQLQIYLSELEQ